MKTVFHKLVATCKLILIFLALTFFFYGLIVWIGDQVYNHYRYDDPKGRAVKVDQPLEVTRTGGADLEALKNRLLFYYWFGE